MHTKKPVNHFLKDRASADRRSQLAPIVTKLVSEPNTVLTNKRTFGSSGGQTGQPMFNAPQRLLNSFLGVFLV